MPCVRKQIREDFLRSASPKAVPMRCCSAVFLLLPTPMGMISVSLVGDLPSVKPTAIVVDHREISPPYLNRQRENLTLCVSSANHSQSEGALQRKDHRWEFQPSP